MDRLNGYLAELNKLLETFSKNPTRTFKSKTLLSKVERKSQLKKEFTALFNKISSDQTINKDILHKIYTNYCEVVRRLEDFLTNNIRHALDNENEDKMGKFEMSKANKNIPEFAGDIQKLDNFLNSIELFGEGLDDENERRLLVQYVLKTRLSRTIVNKISTYKTDSIKEFREALEKIFKPFNDPLSLYTQLGRMRQNGSSITNFANGIENLIADLNRIHIIDIGRDSKHAIEKITDQLGLHAFKNGVNENIKSTIFAARPKTLREAITLAEEYENPRKEESKVFRYNTSHQPNNYRNGNNYAKNNHQNWNRNKKQFNNSQGQMYNNNRNRQPMNFRNKNNFRSDNKNRGKRVHVLEHQGNEHAPVNSTQGEELH